MGKYSLCRSHTRHNRTPPCLCPSSPLPCSCDKYRFRVVICGGKRQVMINYASGLLCFFFFLIIPPFNQKIDFKKFDTCSLYVVQDISRKNSTCRTETSYQLCLTFKKYHLTFKQCMPGRPITQLSMFT